MNGLAGAFKALRALGYFAERNHMCCQSCGWADVPDEKADRAVFMHEQNEELLDEQGYAYVHWAGDGNEIVRVFNENGVATEWNGDENTAIKVIV